MNRDVPSLQHLCLTLLDITPSLAIDPLADRHYPQVRLKRKLLQSSRDGTPKGLNLGEATALDSVLYSFPRNIVVDSCKRTHDQYLRLMNTSEKRFQGRSTQSSVEFTSNNQQLTLHAIRQEDSVKTSQDLSDNLLRTHTNTASEKLNYLMLRLALRIPGDTQTSASVITDNNLDDKLQSQPADLRENEGTQSAAVSLCSKYRSTGQN